MRYEIRVDPGLVSLTVHGILTAEDVGAVRRELLGEPGFSPDLAQLIDARDITGVEMTTKQIAGLADTDPFDPSSRTALVASGDVMYGVFHQYLVFTEREGSSVRLFRDVDEALAWLDGGSATLPPSRAAPRPTA